MRRCQFSLFEFRSRSSTHKEFFESQEVFFTLNQLSSISYYVYNALKLLEVSPRRTHPASKKKKKLIQSKKIRGDFKKRNFTNKII